MELSQLKSEQLEAYLDSLTPKGAEFLVRQVERDRLRGGSTFPHETVLAKARAVLQESNSANEGQPDAEEWFCRPFQDLLTDDVREKKQKGRILRQSVGPVWSWLNDELAFDVIPPLVADLSEAILDEDAALEGDLSVQLYDICARELQTALQRIRPNSKPYYRLAGHLGSERILEDAREIGECMNCARSLLAFRARTPSSITELQAEDVELYVHLYREFEAQFKDNGYLPAMTLYNRFVRPSDFLTVVRAVAGSEEARLVQNHPIGTVCDVILHDMEIARDEARERILSQADLLSIQAALAEFRSLASALDDSFEIDPKDMWGTRLISLRTSLSAVIRDQISAAPRLVKAALFRKRAKDRSLSRKVVDVQQPLPDDRKVAEAEFAVQLLMTVRPYLSQLTINADYSRIKAQVEQFVEVISERLLQDIREGTADERNFAEASLTAAGQLVSIVFGQDEGELYLRRGRAAMKPAAPTQTR